MTRDFDSFSPSMFLSPSALARRTQRKLLNGFWLAAFGLFVYEIFFTGSESVLSSAAAILITAAALLPSYLWCAGSALGMPIFPIFALTFVWTYGLPLVSKHPTVVKYTPESHLFAGFTVTGFLLLGTFIWFQFVKYAPPIPKSQLALNSSRGVPFFLCALVANLLFDISSTAGWLALDRGTFAIVRGVILGLSALGIFVLAYRTGSKELSKKQSQLFLSLLAGLMVTGSVGLLLISAASQFVIATFAFIIGRKKVPLLPIVIVLICLTFLHYGKDNMRGKYWFGEYKTQVQPWEYPAWFSEWSGYSWEYLTRNKNDSISAQDSKEKESFAERSSVIQLLLLTQNKSPGEKPYLYGATYAILPQLLIPRFLDSNKIASHEGTYILNIHYGLQTRKQTAGTTIGWGLLAESYANFGVFGCAGLAVILGLIYGQVSSWSINAPVLSAKYLFAIIVMTLAFQTEYSAGVYVASLFQSSISLGGVAVLFMKSYKTPRLSF
ncbi:hypothetical protein [Fortiea contorta]|uniref:hypothetical protein n=1 Tax=Fortiea contorta TaxID=1892405 RepID=UPI00034A2B68|nr:hypothetical protein [Fortiea contorta]